VARGTFERCPKCDIRPATIGRNRWCNECNAEYQRDYQNQRVTLAREKGYREGLRVGAEEMRAGLLASMRDAHPNGRLLVHEVTDFIVKFTLNPKGNGEGGS